MARNGIELKISPDHYKLRQMECIDEMVSLYGAVCVLNYCICCAHKYRYRAGAKVGELKEVDLAKSDWYIAKARELREQYKLDVCIYVV